jgi:pectin lyase
MVLAEGNMFEHVKTPLLENEGHLFSSPSAAANTICKAYLGRACQHNSLGSSGAFSGDDTEFLSIFKGKTIASAGLPSPNVAVTAGFGKL